MADSDAADEQNTENDGKKIRYGSIKEIPMLSEPFNWREMPIFTGKVSLKDAARCKVKLGTVRIYRKRKPDDVTRYGDIFAEVQDGKTWYNTSIQDLPSSLSSKDGGSIDFRCSCNRWGWGYSDPCCRHVLAVMDAFEKEYGPITLYESDDAYERRAKLIMFQQYVDDRKEQRKKYDQTLIPLADTDFCKNRQLTGTVMFDINAYLSRCCTVKEALDRAERILRSPGDWFGSPDEPVLEYAENVDDGIFATAKFSVLRDPEAPVNPSDSSFLSMSRWLVFQLKTTDVKWLMDGKELLTLPYVIRKRNVEFLNELQLAALALMIRYFNSHPAPITTKAQDQATKKFLDSMNRAINAIDEREDDRSASWQNASECAAFLKPRVVVDLKDVQLGFRVGLASRGKGYVLKNIPNLIYTYENDMEFDLTKNFSLDFGEYDFDSQSMKYYQLLKSRQHEVNNLAQSCKVIQDSGLSSLQADAQQPLNGKLLDDFYDMSSGVEAELSSRTTSASTLSIGDYQLISCIDVKPFKDARGNMVGLVVAGDAPHLLRGNGENCYAMSDTYLSKISSDEYELLSSFYDYSSGTDRFRMVIALDGINEFYCRLLPRLKKSPSLDITVIDEDEIISHLRPEPTFEIDVNIEDAGKKKKSGPTGVTVTPKSVYDDSTFPLAIKSEDAKENARRDIVHEENTKRKMSWLLTPFTYHDGAFRAELEQDRFCDFISHTVPKLQRIGEVTSNIDLDSITIITEVPVKLGISVNDDLLDISITSTRFNKKELQAVLESYSEKQRWYKISDTEFVDLQGSKELEEIVNLLSKIDLVPTDVLHSKAQIPMFRALYLDRLMAQHNDLLVTRDQTYRKLIRSFKSIADSDYDVPENLEKVLREYQVFGYKWLQTISHAGFGAILADEMGLGKTLQIITVLQAMISEKKAKGQASLSLVVSPASLVYQWAEEVKRFAPDIQAVPLTGPASVRQQLVANPGDTNLFIISYELLNRDITLMKDIVYDMVVIDEAQKIKNHKANFTKAVKGLRARVRLALTGTPIENRLSELWSIFDFIMPGFLYGLTKFSRDFETPIAKHHDETATAKLKAMTSPFILRRRKSDVLKDLPKKMEEVVYCHIEGEQQKLYDAHVLVLKGIIKSARSNTDDRFKILSELTKIRQICCDPALILENYDKQSAKKDACMELLENAIDGGHRCLLFSQFTSMLELLEKEMEKRGIPYYKITGSTTKEKRIKLVHEFNEGNVPVFMISLKAGGMGLNLTGADTVIHYDPWWNLAAQNQATDRAHRMGQTKDVTVYKLILKGTIEEKILNLQHTKKDLADAILEGEQQSLMSLSTEELLDLLG